MTQRGEMVQAEVLAVLDRRGCPMSAYGILRQMRETNPNMAPPTIYRALAALRERGYVHRVESLNAFIASRGGPTPQASILSICDDCGSVEESDAPDVLRALSSITGRSGFVAARPWWRCMAPALPAVPAGGGLMPPMSAFRLLLLGAGPRLSVGALVVALLWAAFFWATTAPGAA